MATSGRKEAQCAICKRALPGIETWDGRVHLCDEAGCLAKFRANWHAVYVSEGERKCAADGCDKTVPEGYYHASARRLVCSQLCRSRSHTFGIWHVCKYRECRKSFRGRAEREYCSSACASAERRATTVDRVGRWRTEFLECISQFIPDNYRGARAAATAVVGMALWFEYLETTDICDTSQVGAKTVSDWIAWGRENGRPVQRYISFLSAYMEWLVYRGVRSDNPVTRFHRPRTPKRLPRPYTEREMAYIGALLEKRGTTVVRLECAIAEESGCRVGEIANLRLADVDLVGRRLFIRLPNKTMTERWVPFHDKTATFLRLWLSERDASVKHDHLLHRPSGRPFNSGLLHRAIASVLCKTVMGKKVNEDGLDRWSTHRLRHTMATRLVSGGADAATVMSIGGWTTTEAMAGYAKVEDQIADRGYREAMARAAELRTQPQSRRSSFSKYVKPSPEQRPRP